MHLITEKMNSKEDFVKPYQPFFRRQPSCMNEQNNMKAEKVYTVYFKLQVIKYAKLQSNSYGERLSLNSAQW